MEDVPDFSDREAAKAWLRGHPREVAITLAARAALRVVPALVGFLDIGQDQPSALLLPIWRAILTSSVAGTGATADERFASAAIAARAAAPHAANAVRAAPAARAADAATYAVRAATDATHTAALAIVATYAAASGAATYAADAATQLDAETLAVDATPAQIRDMAIWQGEDVPEPLTVKWRRIRTFLLDANEHWDFWIDWYERHLHGRPQDWDLLERIALIPDEHWQRGPAHVNALIAEMVRLEGTDAKSAARESIGNALSELERHRIGGNNPPEPIADGPTRAEFEELKSALETMQRELARNSEPDRETIERNAETVRTFWLKVWDYCMKNPEVFADEALRSSGKALPYVIGGIGGVLITVVAALFRLIPFL